jgi:large subunit ribosomal protein L17
MRHRKNTVKLGRSSAHKEAMLASLVCSLIQSGRVKTTLPKAKAARVMADKMITLGKKGTLDARRIAVARLHDKEAVRDLFDVLAPAFSERNGGYTRILKMGERMSDSSEMALLEWTETAKSDATESSELKKPSKRRKKEES